MLHPVRRGRYDGRIRRRDLTAAGVFLFLVLAVSAGRFAGSRRVLRSFSSSLSVSSFVLFFQTPSTRARAFCTVGRSRLNRPNLRGRRFVDATLHIEQAAANYSKAVHEEGTVAANAGAAFDDIPVSLTGSHRAVDGPADSRFRQSPDGADASHPGAASAVGSRSDPIGSRSGSGTGTEEEEETDEETASGGEDAVTGADADGAREEAPVAASEPEDALPKPPPSPPSEDEDVREADLESSDPEVFTRALVRMQERINAREKAATGKTFRFAAAAGEAGENASADGVTDGGEVQGGTTGGGEGEGDDQSSTAVKRRHKRHVGTLGVSTHEDGIGREDIPVAHPLSSGEAAALDADGHDLPSDADGGEEVGDLSRDEAGDGADSGAPGDPKEGQLPGSPEFPPLPGCNRVYSYNFVTELGTVVKAESLPVKNVSDIFTFGNGYHYAHMATVTAISSPKKETDFKTPPVLMAAWQAAPGVPPDEKGKQRFAVEGLKDQRILYATSRDGGETWSAPGTVPVRHVSDDNYRAGDRPAWGPVVHYDDETGKVFVFYSLSRECSRPTTPQTWEPGGDVRVIVGEHLAGLDGYVPKWGKPKTLIPESVDGVPKVVAGRMIVLRDGAWLLPFWSEQPRGERIAMFVNGAANNRDRDAPLGNVDGDLPVVEKIRAAAAASSGDPSDTSGTLPTNVDVGACHAPVPPKGQAPELFGNKTYAGVLLSADRGATWEVHGRITDPRTDLIEGVAVELSDRVLMLFRTKIGCVFASASVDGGRTWTPAAPLNVPNANTKFDAIVLKPYSDTILMALNNHRRGPFCESCRTHLHVIASPDGGVSWHHVASVEDEIRTGVRIHYPTMFQTSESRVMVTYSRFYLGKCGAPSQEQLNKNYAKFKDACPGLTSPNQGVKLVSVDVSDLKALPQMRLPSDPVRPEPSQAIMRKVINHYISSGLKRDDKATDEDRRVWLSKLRTVRWREVSSNMALYYDFEYLGGARWLRKNREAAEYFHARVTQMAGEYQKNAAAQGILPFNTVNGGNTPGVFREDGGTTDAGGAHKFQQQQASQSAKDKFTRDAMSRLRKGYFARGVRKVTGGGNVITKDSYFLSVSTASGVKRSARREAEAEA